MSLRVLIMCLIMLIIPFGVNAAESANDFKVNISPGEGQHTFSEGYFHLDSEPGEFLSLEFQVTNTSKEMLNLVIEPVDAYTAEKGGILYSADYENKNSEQLYLSDLVKVQDSISIAPGYTSTVHAHLEIPHSASGTLLGGIMLTSQDAPDESTMAELNKGGSNYVFAQPGQRLLAIKVNLPEKTPSGFSSGKVKFDAESNQLKMKLNNNRPAVLESVQGTYTIMDKDGEVIVNGVIKSFAMAPFTKINYPIDLRGEVFDAGKYVLMIKGKADEKEFFAEEKFTVSDNRAAGISIQKEDASTPITSQTIFRIVLLAAASLLLLLTLLFILDRRNESKSILKFFGKHNI